MSANAVVIATDAAQFPAALFLAKRLLELGPPPDTEVILFSDSLPMLQQAARWGRVRCRLRHISSEAKFGDYSHVSGAALYRYFLPRLSEASRRILYLDIDTYPENTTLWNLFRLDMKGLAIGAVRDVEYAFMDDEPYQRELAETRREDRRYFNSGVLLIDVKRYADLDLERRLVDRSKMPGGWHDQRALNMEVQGHWLELSPAHNMTPLARLAGLAERFPPVISHFKGVWKPWHGALFPFAHSSRQGIEQFVAASPWPDFVKLEMRKRGWKEGDPPVRRIPPDLPPDFFARVAAYADQTPFADRS